MGRHLAARLTAAGRRVTVLDLAPPSPALTAAGATYVRGSVLDPAALDLALRGAEAVVHLAARVSDFGPREAFRALNVEATRLVAERARAAGARRMVHMSSVAAFDYRAGHRGTREDARTGGHEFPYGRTKARAEAVVRDAHGAALETVIVRPGLMPYGPEDRLTSAGLLSAVERGLPVLLGGGRALLSTVYVDDLVDGLVRCVDDPAAAGRCFHLCDDDPLTWRELVTRVAAALGKPAPNLRSAPPALLEPLAAALELSWLITGARGAPPLTRYRVRTATRDLHFSSAQARDLLGWAPAVPLDEGLRRTAAWYRGVAARRGA
jgi:nucleoside-diphosphate-sugar epimerase